MCREGRLYDVEHWIAEGRPLQLAPEAIHKRIRPKTVLQIALETGQHSLVFLLLRSGYRLDLERLVPLNLAVKALECLPRLILTPASLALLAGGTLV
jgi:hypothetical protein